MCVAPTIENGTYMKVGLIGLGNMGTAIANLVASNGYEVIGWEYNKDVVVEINRKRVNTRFLPGIGIHRNVTATNNLEEVIEACKVVFIAIPSAFIKNTLFPFKEKISRDVVIVNLAKGIDKDTGLTSFQVISSLFPVNEKIMLSGPSIANEFSRGLPTVVILAGEHSSSLFLVSQILDNTYFRTRFSDDVIGVELGGILKNIYAIGLGFFDGKNIESTNFKSVYLTTALEEMSKIGVGLGGKLETFLYFSGIGDLLATALSGHSHNRRLGELLAKGIDLESARREMGVLPEGYNTLKLILNIAEKIHISIPLAKGLWEVINGKYEVERFIYLFIKDFIEEK